MAKLTRALLKLFGSSGTTDKFEQFGSTALGATVYTKDILTIQALTAWLDGFQDAVFASNKAPFLESFNALLYAYGYQMVYQFQEGVPEYDATTTYYVGSLVKKTGTSEIYMSLLDNNLGNVLPSKTDNANWQFQRVKGILQYDSGYTYALKEIVQKAGTTELYRSLQANNVGNALPSQADNAFWKYLCDLESLAPPPPGISKIKFGFMSAKVSASSTTAVTVSKIPTVDFGFDSNMSVYAFAALWHTSHSIQAGSNAAIHFDWSADASLSGSGVDSSGIFLNGGSPTNNYTLTTSLTMTSDTGSNAMQIYGVAVFIGIK